MKQMHLNRLFVQAQLTIVEFMRRSNGCSLLWPCPSWSRTARMPFIRDYPALLQDQLQVSHIGDVLERIGADYNQVGELAHLHRSKFGIDTAHGGAVARGSE
jgi:hypothetical protein